MNFSICMKYECKNCKRRLKCFKEEVNYNEYSKNKHRKTAKYNPRKDLKPGDEEYQKIKRSIEEFGFVSPLVVNKDMTVIGGHQRLKVLIEMGYKEVECIVVDLEKTKEKALNIALNQIRGEWDTVSILKK